MHYSDVTMRAIASQITSPTIVYSTLYSRGRSKKTSKLRVTGLCEINSPVTGEFPAQMASNTESVSIWKAEKIVMMLTLLSLMQPEYLYVLTTTPASPVTTMLLSWQLSGLSSLSWLDLQLNANYKRTYTMSNTQHTTYPGKFDNFCLICLIN